MKLWYNACIIGTSLFHVVVNERILSVISKENARSMLSFSVITAIGHTNFIAFLHATRDQEDYLFSCRASDPFYTTCIFTLLLYFFFQTTYFLIPKVFFPLSLIHPGQA
jgi:hypothetical protein